MKNNFWKNFGYILALSGIGIWVYQLYYWLKYAEWKSFSLLWPLSLGSDYQDWIFYPTKWIGFHKVLDFIPLSIVVIVIGLLFIVNDEY